MRRVELIGEGAHLLLPVVCVLDGAASCTRSWIDFLPYQSIAVEPLLARSTACRGDAIDPLRHLLAGCRVFTLELLEPSVVRVLETRGPHVCRKPRAGAAGTARCCPGIFGDGGQSILAIPRLSGGDTRWICDGRHITRAVVGGGSNQNGIRACWYGGRARHR